MSRDEIFVRRALITDIDQVLALERSDEFAPHWPRETYAQMVPARVPEPQCGAGAVRCLLVAVQVRLQPGSTMEHVAGFAVASVVRMADSQPDIAAEIETIAVDPQLRRQGVGRLLCGALLHWARSQGVVGVRLEVRSTNAGAIALYRSLGFTAAGRRPKYYAEPEDDALLMERRLAGDQSDSS